MHDIKISPYHQIFYNEWKLNPSSTQYNIVFDQLLDNKLNVNRLNDALNNFVKDYILINSHLVCFNNQLYWVKNTKIKQLYYIEQDVKDQEDLLNSLVDPFNLEADEPLYRFGLFKQIDNNYRFVVVIHHILIDGSSFDKLLLEISNYYNIPSYHATQNQKQLITLSTNQLYNQLNLNSLKSEHFWQNILLEHEAVNLKFIKLNRSNSTDMNKTSIIAELYFSFDQDIKESLSNISNNFGISIYFYSQIIFAVLLYRYTNQEKFAICYPVRVKEHEDLIYGAGVNTNIFPYKIDKNTKIIDLFENVKQFIFSLKNQMWNNSYFPIHEIIKQTNKNILNVFFAQTNLQNTKFNFTNVQVLEVYHKLNVELPTKLLFEQEVKEKSINYRVRYNSLEFDVAILNKFVSCYKKIFIDVLSDLHREVIDKLVFSYQLLDDLEYRKIVYLWNQTKQYYAKNKTIVQLFAEQVKKSPSSIALICRNVMITYEELDKQSNQLANYILSMGIYIIKPDDLIGIFLEKSQYTIIGILAILKLGGAYLPISPDSPDEMIKYILEDTKPKIVITSITHASKLNNICIYNLFKKSKPLIITIDNKESLSKLSEQFSTKPIKVISSENLAYVIYTSGTTGNPKGVMIEHKNVVSLVHKVTYIDVKKSDRFILLSNIAFDAATFEIWMPLLNGASLFIPYDQMELLSNSKRFKSVIYNNRITVLWLTKTLFDQMFGLDETIFSKLNYLLVGGEALDKNLINKLSNSRYRPKYLLNGYGPTENTTFSTVYRIKKNQSLFLDSIPIGRPLDNRICYILDDNLQPVPIGAIGELYVGGLGLSRGYFNLPKLTKEKFIYNPFLESYTQNHKIINNPSYCEQVFLSKLIIHSLNLYRTGDMVRWLADGNIEYIGRNDEQVKINGYRIEVKEVENKLLEHPSIKDVVVTVKERFNSKNSIGIKYLVGYYVPKNINYNEETQRYISTWKNMYQETYKCLNSKIFNNNFTGWNSSYTGVPIEISHMEEWLNDSVSKVKNLLPVNILEIGSGSGLILFNTVELCNYYYATDFSTNAIEYLETQVNLHRLSEKVKLFTCDAHSIPYDKINPNLDTVVMNSVIQYFPNIQYLEKVIKNIILNLKHLSHIFIGDIRNYQSIDAFYYSILLYKNGIVNRKEIDYYKKREKELLISPEYFLWLSTFIPEIDYVVFFAKECELENEMSKFRYDLVIHLKSNNSLIKNFIEETINYKQFKLVSDIDLHLKSHSSDIYVIIKYPHKNTFKDYQLWFKQLSSINNDFDILGVKQIKEIGNHYGFNTLFHLDVYNCEYLNIIFYKFDYRHVKFRIKYELFNPELNKLYNDPSKMTFMLDYALSNSIKHDLFKSIPSYMMPSILVKIDKLPLTINGKLDRDSLPEPEFTTDEDYVIPRNSLEAMLCNIYSEILGLPDGQIGTNNDFFKLGGNSILAIKLVTKLQENFKISVADIFQLKTPSKIAESIRFTKNNLKQKLEQIRLIYSTQEILLSDRNNMLVKKNKYLSEIKQISFRQKRKTLRYVLLTGATGHLGCHLLYQLLLNGNYKLYLLVRAESNEEAYNRVSKKFMYYFDIDLRNYANNIIILSSDLECTNLGLNNHDYENLVSTVDSILHCGALVKHYGNYEEFYSANVKATEHLLDLSMLTFGKDFHYISTIGLFLEGHVPKWSYYIFDENDSPEILSNFNNFYLQTKYAGEVLVCKYREYGITSSIYRVGNLCTNANKYKNQENLEENSFFQRIQVMLSFGVIPKELSMVEISPVDYTALGIVKIFEQIELNNQIYHVFNPNLFDLTKLFDMYQTLNAKITDVGELIYKILQHMDTDREQIELFMLHQRWLEEFSVHNITKVEVLQDKTNFILSRLGFAWSAITKEMMFDFVKNFLNGNITNIF